MRNAGTEYLSQFLHGQTDMQLFKKNVPIVTYEDIKPYIDRIAHGERSDILLADPITQFIQRYFDGLDQGKTMNLHFVKPEMKTPSGLLQHHEVVRISSTFASVLVRSIKFLEDYWKEMCSNIRTGCLSDWNTDRACRNAMSSILARPNPELADTIEQIFKDESWEGIIKKLWPHTKCILSIVTGSMSEYISLLDLYGGGIPLVSLIYTSSEATFGINLNPLSKPSDASYTFLLNMAYFEFLLVNKDSGEKAQKFELDGASSESLEMMNENGNLEPVDLTNVKLGQCYEVVVTTSIGKDSLL
ncbi:hypothetical protein DITRI_Ditri14bG0113500 [Diplodiscus trichospermus]